MNIFQLLKRNYNIKYLLEAISDKESLYKYIFDRCSLYKAPSTGHLFIFYDNNILIEFGISNIFIYEDYFYKYISNTDNAFMNCLSKYYQLDCSKCKLVNHKRTRNNLYNEYMIEQNLLKLPQI